MLLLTPPMGWNSWNTFGEAINEQVVLESADTLVSSGLAALGYNYLVIDDCWSLRERGEDGRLVPDPEKFPHGMKFVADYVHSKGLKFGMYSCAGTLTCAGYPASFEHEFVDAKTFADWGVDYLKYDYCFHPSTIPGKVLYKRMALALANCGRDIVFSACSWGSDETKTWIKETGANLWRTTGDINDSWRSIKDLSLIAEDAIRYGSINCYPDMDMLVVGMGGKGNVGLAGCTPDEYRLHYSLWALLGSPLMIGCDIRSMDEETRKTLMNPDVIAINQDADYNQAYDASAYAVTYMDGERNEHPIYVRLLSNGDLAVGFFNFADETSTRWNSYLALDRIGLPESTGKTLKVKELWTGEEKTITNGIFSVPLPAHSCRLYRAEIVDAR
ncbi:MAG: glycoside hydrolase family 27 protein [Firmicutes bacterium]|nr:glycoside hydrolase family 27 protein [Bacillota bacterium]